MSTDRTRPFRNIGGSVQIGSTVDSEKIGANRKIVGKFQIRKIRSESDPCRALIERETETDENPIAID